MAPGDSARARTATTLQLREGLISFMTAAGEEQVIPAECLQRSSIFQALLDSFDSSAEAEVPVTPAALQLWIRISQKLTCNSGTDGDPPASSASGELHPPGSLSSEDASENFLGLMAQEACLLLSVSDILADDRTKDVSASTILAMMKRWQHSADGDPAADEAVAALPEHLQLSVLSLAPLRHCLHHLPPSWHPLALRAHHPSIDAHATLALHRLPIECVDDALSAAATLTALRALSLAGLTLPGYAAPCISLLAELTALTALNLHDTGLGSLSALASVLPRLWQLEHLDLSNNCITQYKMRALAPALRRCTGLRSLNLWHTLKVSVQELPTALEPLQLLTSLAIGVYPYYDTGFHIPVNSVRGPDFGDVLRQLPRLVSLKLHLLNLWQCPGGGAPSLGQVTQLQSLRCTANLIDPILFSTAAQLTSLQLDDVKHSLQLPHLTQLQRLWLRLSGYGTSEEGPWRTLREVLPCMLHLSHLEMREVQGTHRNPWTLDSSPPVYRAGFIEVALVMPRLRVLHVPVTTQDRRLQEHVVSLAVLLAQGLHLSIDLYLDGSRAVGPTDAGTIARLLPYVETLHFCQPDAGDMGVLIEQAAALCNTREVRFACWRIDDHECISGLRKILPSLTQLRSLEVWLIPVRVEARRASKGLASCVRALRGLTRLVVDCNQHKSVIELFVRSCVGLRGLQVLVIQDMDADVLRLCEEKLLNAPLRVLHGDMTALKYHVVDVERRKGIRHLCPLQHLRVLSLFSGSNVYDIDDEYDIKWNYTRELPAFQEDGSGFPFTVSPLTPY